MNSVITAGFAAAADYAGGKKNKDMEVNPFEILWTWIATKNLIGTIPSCATGRRVRRCI